MNKESSRPRGDVLGIAGVVVSACAYGTVPIFAKVAFLFGISLTQFLTWRFALAAALLWIIALVMERRFPTRMQFLRLIAMGAAGYAGQAAAFFGALERIPAAMCALLLYTYPAIVTLGAAAFLREHLTRRKLVAIVVAFAGTTLLVQGHAGGLNTLGVAFAMLSALMYSGYVLFGSHLFRETPPIATAASVMSATAISFWAYAALTGTVTAPANATNAALIAIIAVVGTAIPVLAFVIGMPRVGPSRASILSTIEPVVTIILATIVLGEPLRLVQMAGAACVLGSVIVLEARRPAQV